MKNLKRIVLVVAAVGLLTLTSAVFADGFKTPAQIVSELTGKTVSELYDARESGQTFGTIAKDAGVLDAFQKEMLEQKKVILDQRVKDGKLTQEQADEIYKTIEENQAACDGSGSKNIGRHMGAGFGNGQGNGAGLGNGNGNGRGRGQNGQGSNCPFAD